jgi:protein TonB
MSKAPASLQQFTVVGAVALAHAAGLWALLDHALQPAASAPAPLVAMLMLLNEAAAVATPPALQPPPQAQPTPRAAPTAAARRPPSPLPPRPAIPPAVTAAVPVPTELPLPSSETAPAPAVAAAAPAPSAAEGQASAPVQVAKAAPATGVTRRIEDVDYLRAPVLEYPSASRRFGEHGRVVLRVLIGPDGQAEKIELHEASAFQRLNDAAIEAARRALYKPYTEDGVAQPAWALVALSFQLRR